MPSERFGVVRASEIDRAIALLSTTESFAITKELAEELTGRQLPIGPGESHHLARGLSYGAGGEIAPVVWPGNHLVVHALGPVTCSYKSLTPAPLVLVLTERPKRIETSLLCDSL